MGLWARLTGRWRLRGVLAEHPDTDEAAERPRARPPAPTPSERIPPRPEETPSMRRPKVPERTAGTPRYGSPKGTPSTRTIHNPTHIR